MSESTSDTCKFQQTLRECLWHPGEKEHRICHNMPRTSKNGWHIKTSRPGAPHTWIEIARYPPDPTICPYTCLREYIHRTQKLRGTETMLFISYVKPYKPVSRDTISRWTKATLKSVASTLQFSLLTAPGQPLRPKCVRRQSLYTRLWPRLVGIRHKHFTNFTLSQ